MRRKSIAIWALTSITFISLVHFIEAITTIMFNNPIRLLHIYPYTSELVKSLTPITYLYVTAAATAILWAITCLVAFNNPVELYIKKRQQTEAELRDRDELLDHICETVESDHQTLTQMKDLICRMQSGIKEEQAPLLLKEVPNVANTSMEMKTKASKAPISFTKSNGKLERTPLLRRKQKVENRKTKVNEPCAMLSMRKLK